MSTTDWTPPGWDTEVTPKARDGWRSVQMTCRAEGCGQTFHFGLPPGVTVEGVESSHLCQDHQAQHGPGRARDIEVDWILSAECSVCEDGIGTVTEDSDGLVCQECGTTWDREGSFGELEEER